MSPPHGATARCCLGFAANCKNEGVALLAAVTLAHWRSSGAATCRARIAREALVAGVCPCGALDRDSARSHALPTDLAGGGALARFVERLGPRGLRSSRCLPVAPLPALGVDRRSWRVARDPRGGDHRGSASSLPSTAIQLVFFVAAYFATPYDVGVARVGVMGAPHVAAGRAGGSFCGAADARWPRSANRREQRASRHRRPDALGLEDRHRHAVNEVSRGIALEDLDDASRCGSSLRVRRYLLGTALEVFGLAATSAPSSSMLELR